VTPAERQELGAISDAALAAAFRDVAARNYDTAYASLFRAHVIEKARALAAAASPVSQDALDARRYRWLRDESEPGICAFYLSVGDAFKGVRFARETVDAAIDEQITRAASPLPEGE
jgi:hypothetical protein